MNAKVLLVVAALAAVASVSAGTSNPIAISTGQTLTTQLMNATGGNFYTYAATSTNIAQFTQFFFKVSTPFFLANQAVVVTAYWQLSGQWTAMTPSSWYSLSFDMVSTAGYMSASIDPKKLYDQYSSSATPPSSINIGFLVSTSSTVPYISNSVFSVTLSTSSSSVANDANGDIGSGGNPGTQYTGSCPGTYTRCQAVANMRSHDHLKLEAAAAVTAGNFLSATMRSAEVFEVDDTEYFAGATAATVYPTTCSVTNSSCSIAQAYYYVELRTTSTATDSNTYSVTWTTKAGAHAAASASLLTVLAVAAASYFASKN